MSFIKKLWHKAMGHDSSTEQEDIATLEKLGYKQELYRGFNGLMNFAFTFTAVGVLASITITFGIGLSAGGPVSMVWGWIVGCFFTLIVAACMAEICSVLPQAGSVYYWSGQLGGSKYGPLAAWVTGWFNLVGNAAGDASFAMGVAVAIQAASCVSDYIKIGEPTFDQSDSSDYPDVGISDNATVGIAIVLLFVQTSLNALRVDKLGYYNISSAFFQLFSSFAIFVTVLATSSSYQTGSYVFTGQSYVNGVGYQNTAYVIFVGLLYTLFSLSGYEAGAHMAEETNNPRKAAPKGIVNSVMTGIVSGFIFMLGLLFAMGDLGTLLSSPIYTLTGNPVVQIYVTTAGYKGGLALAAITCINVFLAGVSSVTVTSRIAFAMVRDGAFPGSKYLKHVNSYTKEPLRVVCCTFIFSTILICTSFGSSTAFAAVTSITTIGFQISYMVPILMRLTIARKTFVKGPFHLGPFSIVCGWAAVGWLTLTSIFFLFPTEFPITVQNMNYACVMVGAIFFFAGSWWILSARKWFKPAIRGVQDIATDLKQIQPDVLQESSSVTGASSTLSQGEEDTTVSV